MTAVVLPFARPAAPYIVRHDGRGGIEVWHHILMPDHITPYDLIRALTGSDLDASTEGNVTVIRRRALDHA